VRFTKVWLIWWTYGRKSTIPSMRFNK
jgi:hypothetical protein